MTLFPLIDNNQYNSQFSEKRDLSPQETQRVDSLQDKISFDSPPCGIPRRVNASSQASGPKEDVFDAVDRTGKILDENLKIIADVDQRDEKGRTSLHRASISGDMEKIKALLKQGVDVNAQDEQGKTPLHYCAANGNLEAIELFHENGAEMNIRDKKGQTALHSATECGESKAMNVLIDKGAEKDAQDVEGNAPLHLATKWGDQESMEVLMDRGAGKNIQNEKEQTPLHVAVIEKDQDALDTLLAKRVDVSIQDKEGFTPLHLAVIKEDQEAVNVWIHANANMDAVDGEGRTSLHHAALKRTPEITASLIGKVDVSALDNRGRTPLHWAAQSCNMQNALLLAEQMKETNIPDKDGYTPYTLAKYGPEKKGKESLLNLLDDKGYSIRFMIKKFLILRFGLEDTGQDMLENRMGLSELARSFESFLKNMGSKTDEFTKKIADNALKLIEESTHNIDKTPKQLFEDYLAGKPILLPTIWEGHQAMLFISRKERLVIKGNRGERSTGEPGMEFFRLGEDLKLSDFKQLKNSSISQEYFEKGINEKLELYGSLEMKEQKNNNCVWAAAKMSLFMSLYYELVSKGINHKQAMTFARQGYKSFTQGPGGDREIFLIEKVIAFYTENGLDQNELDLLEAIWNEMKYQGNPQGLKQFQDGLEELRKIVRAEKE